MLFGSFSLLQIWSADGPADSIVREVATNVNTHLNITTTQRFLVLDHPPPQAANRFSIHQRN